MAYAAISIQRFLQNNIENSVIWGTNCDFVIFINAILKKGQQKWFMVRVFCLGKLDIYDLTSSLDVPWKICQRLTNKVFIWEVNDLNSGISQACPSRNQNFGESIWNNKTFHIHLKHPYSAWFNWILFFNLF